MRMPQGVRDLIARSSVAYVASADEQGRPHLAVSKLIRVLDSERVTFTAWFCPQTTENVAQNRRVAVAVWRPEEDRGYQLVGEVVGSAVTAVIDGWEGQDPQNSLPQEERKLTIRVDSILELKSGQHSDESL